MHRLLIRNVLDAPDMQFGFALFFDGDGTAVTTTARSMNLSTIAGFRFGSAHCWMRAASIISVSPFAQRLNAVMSGRPKSFAQADKLACWMATIEMPAVHQPLPVATMMSGP